MARFTYDRLSWSSLSERAVAKGVRLEEFAAWFMTPAYTMTAWRAGTEPVPTWFVVALDLLEDADISAFRETSLSPFLARWGMHTSTLARLLGINPTTAKNWRREGRHEPYYLPRLLGLMSLPGGLHRARRSVANLIAHDRRNPDLSYPFTDGTRDMLAEMAS